MQLCGSLSILWHCLSLGLEWNLTFSSPVATAEFSKFAGILSAVLSQHHLSGFERVNWNSITSNSFFSILQFCKSYLLLNQLYKQRCKNTNVNHIIKFMLIEGECSRCQCQTDSLFHWLLIILSHLSFIFGPWVTQFFAFTKDFNCLFFFFWLMTGKTCHSH